MAGIPYPDFINHNNPNLPLVDDNQLGGGYRVVADKTARNAIPLGKRKINGLVAWAENGQNVIMRYDGPDVTDVNWQNDSNWESIGSLASEIFSNAFEWGKVGRFDTGGKAYYSVLAMFGGNASKPSCYYYEGDYKRFYFTYLGAYLDFAGNVKDSGETVAYVAYYDIDTKQTSRDVKIPHGYPQNTDLHNVPTIIVSDDGHILIFQESLKPSGTHNSSIEVWRSNSAEKIEDLSNPGIHDFSLVAEFGSPVSTTYGLSYPRVTKGLSQGVLFLMVRGNGGGNGHANLLICKSIDNGLTWKDLSGNSNSLTLIADCNPTTDTLDWYFYANSAHGKRSDGLNIVTHINEGYQGTNPVSGQAAASRYKVMHFLHSMDGVTWGDVVYKATSGASGWSKDILSSGAISRVELDTEMLIYDLNPVQNESIGRVSAGLDNLGNPFVAWSKFQRPTVKTGDARLFLGMYLEYFDGSSWAHLDIESLLSRSNVPDDEPSLFYNAHFTIPYEPGVIELVLYRFVGTENISLTKYSPISSDSKRLLGCMYKIVSTETDHFGAGLVVGDFILVTSTTPSCDANNTLIAFDTEVVSIRTADYGRSWSFIKRVITPSDSILASNSNITGVNFNYMDAKKALLFVGIPCSKNGTCLTHSDFDLFYGEYNPKYKTVEPPTVATVAISNITATSAISGGQILDSGNGNITDKGICFSTAPNPTISDQVTHNGILFASFASQLIGLTEETDYYVRAYAINSAGVGYGNEESFTTIAPPVTYPYGYFAGGATSAELVANTDRLTFSNGVMAANTVSSLSIAKSQYAGVSDASTYGYFMGGYTPSVAVNTTDRITYSTEVIAANTVSNLSMAKRGATGISDGANYGYACGGYSSAYTASTDRLTFSTGASAANTVSNLSQGRQVSASINNGSDYGYIMGGNAGSPVTTSDRIIFSTGVVSANTISNIPVATYAPGSVSDRTTYGYFGGGYTTEQAINTYRITFSTEVVAANTVSNLSVARLYLSGTYDDVYGYFVGGSTLSNNGVATTDRITFSTGVTAVNTVSNLSVARWGFVGLSGQSA